MKISYVYIFKFNLFECTDYLSTVRTIYVITTTELVFASQVPPTSAVILKFELLYTPVLDYRLAERTCIPNVSLENFTRHKWLNIFVKFY